MPYTIKPREYHKGYCPTKCRTYAAAIAEHARLEKATGFRWIIEVNTNF